MQVRLFFGELTRVCNRGEQKQLNYTSHVSSTCLYQHHFKEQGSTAHLQSHSCNNTIISFSKTCTFSRIMGTNLWVSNVPIVNDTRNSKTDTKDRVGPYQGRQGWDTEVRFVVKLWCYKLQVSNIPWDKAQWQKTQHNSASIYPKSYSSQFPNIMKFSMIHLKS